MIWHLKRLQKDFDHYIEPYLSTSGDIVRWIFEEVLDVQELSDPTLKTGSEVYYEMHGRRLRARYRHRSSCANAGALKPGASRRRGRQRSWCHLVAVTIPVWATRALE